MIQNSPQRESYVTSQIDGFRLWLEEKHRAENTILVTPLRSVSSMNCMNSRIPTPCNCTNAFF